MAPLSVVFLWHQHQPNYYDPMTGDFIMPWVRLHALKDYYDMAAYIENVPDARATINLVPSLLTQLEAYIDGASDTWLDLAHKPAGDLTDGERLFVIQNFLAIRATPMLAGLPHYIRLQKLCAENPAPDQSEQLLHVFDEQKLRDITVLFQLAWCGQTLKREPVVERLIAKGSDFSEQEKLELLALQRDFLPRVFSIHQRLQREGRIELSTTPFYHPILPLLINTDSGREMLPNAPFPEKKFSYPQDARRQLQVAQKFMLERFDLQRPGMWPSEGSISHDTCIMACAENIPWLASDEEVLRNSLDLPRLEPRHLYRAYQFGCDQGEVSLFFRDRTLSDLIGFTLAAEVADAAVNRFMKELNKIHDQLPDDKRSFLVPVILDGENAWEHYANNGEDFLNGLYHALVEDSRYQLTTFEGFLADQPTQLPLTKIRAGSWIYGNLATWIGQEEKNEGWRYLSRTRLFCEQLRQTGGTDAGTLEQMQQRIEAAEGSDWFWWYGDDHHTENAEEFDRLFRHNQQAVYQLAEAPVPDYLKVPIISAGAARAVEAPVQLIRPVIDGQISNYFEWISAGRIQQQYSAIHRDRGLINEVRFGIDTDNFYLLVDFTPEGRSELPAEFEVLLQFAGLKKEVRLSPQAGNTSYGRKHIGECCLQQVLEASVRLNDLRLPRDRVNFRVRLTGAGELLEVLPYYGDAEVDLDSGRVQSENWFV